MTREAEGHLSVSSSGEVKAGRETDLGYATQETKMNTKTETTRLQALAVNELQDIVMQARQNAAIEANGVIRNFEKTLKGPFEQKIRTNPAMPVRTPPLPQAPIRR